MATTLKHTIKGKLLIFSIYLQCLTVLAQNGTSEFDQNSTGMSSSVVLDGAITETHPSLSPTGTLTYEQPNSSVDTQDQTSQTIVSSVDSSKVVSVWPDLEGPITSTTNTNTPSFNLDPSLYEPESLASSYTVTPGLAPHSGSYDQIQQSSAKLIDSSGVPIIYPRQTDTMESSSLKRKVLITETPIIESAMETSVSGTEATTSKDKDSYRIYSRTVEQAMDSSLFVQAEISVTPSAFVKQLITSKSEDIYAESQYIDPSPSEVYSPLKTDSTLYHTDYSSATLSKQSFFIVPSESEQQNYSEMELASRDSSSSFLYNSDSLHIDSSSSPYMYTSSSPDSSSSTYIYTSSSTHLDSSGSPYMYTSSSPNPDSSGSPYMYTSSSPDSSSSPYMYTNSSPYLDSSDSPYMYTSSTQYPESSSLAYFNSSSSPYLSSSSPPYLDSSVSESYIPLVSDNGTFPGVSEESSLPPSDIIEPTISAQLSTEVSDTLLETTYQVEWTYSPSLSYEPIAETQSVAYNQTSEDMSTILASTAYDETAIISSSGSYESSEFQSMMYNQSSTTRYSSSSGTPDTSYNESEIFPSSSSEWGTIATTTGTPMYTANLTSESYTTDDTTMNETPIYPYISESTESWPLPEQTSSESPGWADYQTEMIEVDSSSTWLESEQTLLSTSSKEEFMPTPTSSLETPPPATVEITSPFTVTTPKTLRNQKFILTFNGDCQPLVNDKEKTQEFQKKVETVLVEYLEISSNEVLMDRLACGSVKSYVVIYNATQNYSSNISELVSSGNFLIDVYFPEANSSVSFRAYKMDEVSLTDQEITDNAGKTNERKLSDQDITLIILACCISVIIVIIVVVVCARRMYSKKYAQSFNLMDTPHAHLKMEDFTLTQVPRQRRSYDGECVQVQSYSHYQSNGQPLLTSGHPNTTHNHSADLDSTLERSVDVGEFRLQDNKTSSFVPTSRSFDFTPNGGHTKSDRLFPATSMDASSSIHERSTENLVPGINGSTVHGSVNPIYSGDETEATASVSSDPPPYSDGAPNNL